MFVWYCDELVFCVGCLVVEKLLCFGEDGVGLFDLIEFGVYLVIEVFMLECGGVGDEDDE